MIADMKTPGRNDPCPCGSGLKFKKCCIKNPLNPSPKYTPERGHHWSQQEIDEFPTEMIIEKLGMCGISFTEDVFLKDVEECCAASDIYNRWKARFTLTATGFDADFPRMAAEVLWQRLAPGKVNTEQLDELMQDGYALIEQRDHAAGCRLWLTVWDHLKPRFTKAMRTIEQADTVFEGYQHLFNWCQDVELELGNAAIDDRAFHDHRIRYCREFCEFFPDEKEIVEHMKQAVGEALFRSGRVAAAERHFEQLVKEYPKSPWSYITWGDLYVGYADRKGDPQRAEELYRKALGIDPAEGETIRQRLRDLKDARQRKFS